MYEYRVRLTYATHYVVADDYSVSGGFYIFWLGKTNVRMFPEEDVEKVERKKEDGTFS
jgi:hypothetical protein